MTPAERIAHDIICIVKYGSPGGSAPTSDVKRVVDYMERAGLVKREVPAVKMPAVTIPKINGLPVLIMHKPDAPSVQLPSIRLP